MRATYHRRRLADFVGAARLARELAERERWPREQLRAYQQARLNAIVHYAAERSPFHRARLKGLRRGDPVELERLPVLEKDEMMARFDELVTDRRLRRDDILARLEGLERDELHLGRYRAMTTSGSSGRKGLFVYDPDGWRSIVAQFLRFNALAGIRPRLPQRTRIAAITGAGSTHMSRQVSASLPIPVHRVLALDVTTPIAQLVDVLNRFAPDVFHAYPSVALRLAEEQATGSLRISPSVITTGSELCTPDMTARIVDAFGVHPTDLYATTEGLWACECERHEGFHVFEDASLVENVDASGRPVPVGEPGERLLVTNLDNRVQPLIRLAVADAAVINPEPCRCGRTLVRMSSVEGRSDDVLELPGAQGGKVTVYPLEFARITRDREVREFQVVRERCAIRILVVARNGVGPELERRIASAVGGRLRDLGAGQIEVTVERRDSLARSPGGKLQLVIDRSDR